MFFYSNCLSKVNERSKRCAWRKLYLTRKSGRLTMKKNPGLCFFLRKKRDQEGDGMRTNHGRTMTRERDRNKNDTKRQRRFKGRGRATFLPGTYQLYAALSTRKTKKSQHHFFRWTTQKECQRREFFFRIHSLNWTSVTSSRRGTRSGTFY